MLTVAGTSAAAKGGKRRQRRAANSGGGGRRRTATDGGETDAFEIAAMATLYECEEVSSSGGSWQTPLFDWKPALSTLARLLLGSNLGISLPS